MKKKLVLLFSSFFYIGFSPIAPGTVGTLGGVGLYLLFRFLHIGRCEEILFLLILLPIGIWISGLAEEILKEKDPGPVVIDEVIGFLVTMLWIPFSWFSLIAGFLLNRFFDIWKPFPVRHLQNLRKGWGIVLDDILSSFYAHCFLRFFLFLLKIKLS
ncbi:MAG: phosphatidylglycerophosphatase A [Chlamydiae bacterium]|nr:phosphatidylglycerophosphatase A [Chlamydiota bacterium]MBI3277916.1 phosphatidylglycerophosphatase A [Chlamydiota bacterium]